MTGGQSAAEAQARSDRERKISEQPVAPASTVVKLSQAQALAQSQQVSKSQEPSFRYTAERLIGNGSFGVVYQAVCAETGEVVAIKKVLQDKRFKVW